MRASGFRRHIALLLLTIIGTTAATNTECTLTARVPSAAQEPPHPHPHDGEHAHQHAHDGKHAHPHADPHDRKHAHPHAPAHQHDGKHPHPPQHDAAPAPSDATHDPTHESGGCGLLMACGLAAPAAHAPDVAFQTQHFPTDSTSVRDAYASPTLAFEPPPPRDLLS